MYHVNPETGSASRCVAKQRCRYGDAAPHAATAQLARIAYEQSQMAQTVPAGLQRAEANPLTPTELTLLTQRAKLQLMSHEFKSATIDKHTTVEAFFKRWDSCSFHYEDDATVKTFTQGACGYLAYELHQRTGLPLTLLSLDESNPYWEGHAAVRVGKDQYLDINGVQSLDALKGGFHLTVRAQVEREVQADAFLTRMALDPSLDPADRLDPLERAMLNRVGQDVVANYLD